jgi:hypothetical protein
MQMCIAIFVKYLINTAVRHIRFNIQVRQNCSGKIKLRVII